MKTVILVHHAQAQPPQLCPNDKERTLTMQGMQSLQSLRKNIQPFLSDIDVVICSNAMRTRQTLSGIAEGLKSSVEVVYDDVLYSKNSPSSLTDVLHSLDDCHKGVLIVGHNPGLSQFVSNINETQGNKRLFKGMETTDLVCLKAPQANHWVDLSINNLLIDQHLLAA